MLIFLGAWLAGQVTAQSHRASTALSIASTADSVIVLTDGRRYQPGLYGLVHLYTLQVPGGVPFFVLRGVAGRAGEGDAMYALYVLRPGEHLSFGKRLHGFAFPGRSLQMLSDSADAYRRQFFGQCLNDAPSAAVQLAHEQGADGSWVDSIRTLVPANDSLIARNYLYTDSLAREVLRLARAKQCREYVK